MHGDWIRKWATYTPDRMALRDHRMNRSWSYSELNTVLDRVAWYLSNDLKIKPGDRIAVFSRNCIEYPFLFFASIRIGSILVPLNFRLTASELDVLLKDAEPSAVIYEEDLMDSLGELKNINIRQSGHSIRDILTVADDPLRKTDVTDYHQGDNDPLMILYTSGTTGIPKGAMITPKMLFYNSINTELRLDINSFDHTLGFAPFFHTGGWNVLLTPFLHHGASQTLMDSFEPDTILDLIANEKVTLLFGVPTMLQMLTDSPKFETSDFSSLRYIIVGGAPMPIPLIQKWHAKGVFIRQGYGLTEVGPNCYSLHQNDAERKKGSIGFPNFYIDAKVLDEHGNECAANEVGELCLKSPVVTPGYWRKPKETAEAIVDGWFHTGDMVRFDDEGFYYVVDRKKNMFISGGENVYPAEVEGVLNTIPGVIESAVIGVPHEKWGEVGKAFIVSRNAALATGDVLDFCKTRLAKYKIPKHVTFINELPRNDAGKIDRNKLSKNTN